MFDSVVVGVSEGGAPADADWLDSGWDGWVPDPHEVGQIPPSQRAPSGWLALELDHDTADPTGLSDADLIEGIIGFDRLSSWAGARQARLLAEFTRRRPPDHWQARRSDTPSRCSEFAPDEVGLALRLSRTAASNRLALAQTLLLDLPGTLTAWEGGRIDTAKVRAITETAEVLAAEQCPALEARILGRAPEQTVAQLRRSLLRAVLAIDPAGAARRHQARRADRRVVVSPDGEGMASLWALLPAPDATAAYQRLGQLARGLGAGDCRGMDARRADLLVELLTGRRCAATGCTALVETDCDGDCSDASNDPTDTDADRTDADRTDAARTEAAETGGTEGTAPVSAPVRNEPGGRPDTASGGCGCGGMARRGEPGKPLVQVTVPITMLMGLDESPGELAGYGPIPAGLAREIAAGGTWRRLLTDPASGVLLDYGRTTYTPPPALADFVRARDVCCRYPTCQQPAAHADLDHTIAYDDDGHTSQHNLYAGCRHHHLAKTHLPGWSVTQRDDGRITWTTPTGHSYSSRPHDYRPDPHAPPPTTAHPPAPGADTDPDPPF